MNVAGNGFRIGDIKLDPKAVNEDSLKSLGDTAKALKAQRVEGADVVPGLVSKWIKSGSISEEDYSQIREMGKKAYGLRKRLTNQWWEMRPLDKNKTPEELERLHALEAKLADVRVFASAERSLGDSLREARALTTVQAIAGASFGPVGTVAAYAAWVTQEVDKDAIGAAMEKLEGLRNGESSMLFPGNKVTQVHQHRLWQSINQMLDEAIASGEKGKPVPYNDQHYEFTSDEVLTKVARLAQLQSKVRINVDPALRLSYPDSNGAFDVDDVPQKFRSILQLTNLAKDEKLDVAVSLYPVAKNLVDPTNLMHRKVMNIGNKVLLSGMNANEGSGENVDAGYIIEGPAAAQLVKNFKRDVQQSIGVSRDDIFGEDYIKNFNESTVLMGRRGITCILDCLCGVPEAGTPVAPLASFPDLKRRADQAKVNMMEFFDVPEEQFLDKMQKLLAGEEKLPLSAHGKEICAKLFRMTMDAVQSPANQKRLADIPIPSDARAGNAVVAIADLPEEREAAMLHAISQAEEFVYMPAFVITRAVASAIVARSEELKAQGKTLDVKIIADPGVYPRGDTPNSWGVKFLEDYDIPCRWALLPRTGWHDRKIHAKQLLTDKHEMFGSTNFSNKGMRDNWEESGLVEFNPKDKESMENRATSKALFEHLWEHESFELSSIALASAWKSKVTSKDKAEQIEEARDAVIKKIIKQIEVVEEESGTWMERQAQKAEAAAKIEEYKKAGMSDGYATYLGVRDTLGEDKFYEELDKLPARIDLERMKPRSRGAGEEE